MKNKILLYLFLVVVGIIPYINSLKNPLIWDDIELIFNDPNIKQPKNFMKFFSSQYWRLEFQSRKNTYRPLRAISFVVDYLIWRRNSFGYHLTNVLLNAVAVVLAYVFIKTISGSELIGVLTAVVFAVLPYHVETVTWVKNRTEILSFIFFILSLIYFMKSVYDGDNFRVVYRFLLVSILFFVLSLMSKENAVMLPFVVFTTLLLKKENIKRVLTLSLPYFVVFAIYIVYNFTNFVSELGNTCEFVFSSLEKILIVPATIYEYIKIFIWPFPLNAERSVDIPKSFFSAAVGVVLIYVITTVILLNEDLKQNRLTYGFAMLNILLLLIPISNIVHFIGREIAEQRMYTPSLFFSYLVLLLITGGKNLKFVEFATKHPLRIICIVCLVLFNGVVTYGRNFDWRDEETFWKKTVEVSPLNLRARYNLAMAYRAKGDYAQAIDVLTKTLQLSPDYYHALFGLGVCYEETGKYQQAIECFNKVLSLVPQHQQSLIHLGRIYTAVKDYQTAIKIYKEALNLGNVSCSVYYNLAIAYENCGDTKSAIEYYKLASQKTKDDAFYYTSLGVMYEKSKDLEKAKECYLKSLQIDPGFIPAIYNLGYLYLQMKDYDVALEYFIKVSKLKPTDIDTINNIGIIYEIKNEHQKALEYFNKAMQINPLDPKAYYNRAQVYLKTGKKILAKQDFIKVLELEPWNKNAKEQLRKL